MRVCIRPQLKSDTPPPAGIDRVLAAQIKHLPAFGVELVDDPLQADLCVGHTRRFDMPTLDVLHSHGAYWTGDLGSGIYTDWHQRANNDLVIAFREARMITVPSRWVARLFQRDMRVNPTVIGHGIDFADWQPGKSKSYVLWNKNRNSDVCSPQPAHELAARGIQVISTYAWKGEQPKALTVIGSMPHEQMRELIAGCSVYLSTTKETFGIGTLEAMACAKPVLGFDWGATPDIVTHGVDGWLVKPGDFDALLAGYVQVMAHRAEMGEAAREKARKYDWPAAIEKYAQLYAEVLESKRHERYGVAVVITNYNYAQYVGEAIESALSQAHVPEEIIVVDDGSTDSSLEVIRRYGDKVHIIEQANQGVAHARNAGIAATQQPFIVCLDADDRLDPRFLEMVMPEIQYERPLGIAYTGLGLIRGDVVEQNPWPVDFLWANQSHVSVPPSNCIPSACVFRREMWERAGGFRQEYAPGEDAEFWTRGLSVGFTARKVTSAPLFWYRLHDGSASRAKVYRRIDDRMPWMRDGHYPAAAPSREAPPIRSYSRPRVSVVIPVGPGHAKWLPDALESLLGQTMRDWEAICVLDSEPLPDNLRRRYPFVEWVKTTSRQASGPAAARNLGVKHAHAPLLLFLDADDLLDPNALEAMLREHVQSGGRYVYPDALVWDGHGESHVQPAREYEQVVWHGNVMSTWLHSVTALIPRAWFEAVGGFDKSLIGWEEGGLFTRLAVAGYCGKRIAKPLLVYRSQTGTVRKFSHKQQEKILAEVERKYGGVAMSSCCGGDSDALLAAKRALMGITQVAAESPVPEGRTRLVYTGENIGSISFFGAHRQYRGGRNEMDAFANVDNEDVLRLLGTGKWERAPRQPREAEQPAELVLPHHPTLLAGLTPAQPGGMEAGAVDRTQGILPAQATQEHLEVLEELEWA